MKQNIKLVCILGASGYIGSSVLDAALADPGTESVIALEHQRPLQHTPAGKLSVLRSSLQQLQLPDNEAVYLVHAARQASGNGRIGRWLKAMGGARANSRILQSMARQNNGSKLAYISGSLMYGSGGDRLITESAPLHPLSFARDYIAAEQPFNKAISAGNTQVRMIRVPWVWGNGSWFSRFYLQVMQAEGVVPLYGKGQNIMTLIDREDLGRCILEAGAVTSTPVLNLFMEDYITQETFVQLLSSYSHLPVKRISDNHLQQQYPSAVAAAFRFSLRLGSRYDQSPFRQVMQYHDAATMIAARLPGMLSGS